uniref:Uncharacterized protein n=1 Tax=Chromera velia CCMP2878 TaxID=1169474 RepID=A0A0G4GKE7_9ALVE|eukprot:Cvel_4830.t1-p1 / transcript=Cvel_4830.t1 / gene=Cvel_4830 / organism=Chromera_velia_CCMP2878 / gene_product=hypothetical protein / transcript_product=hypothetical protein / location=Cvel_scaffold217:100610-101972(-) / protein_length=199 / sequence_SO=supercontig / SO=protein_coding / is_pseudo=false
MKVLPSLCMFPSSSSSQKPTPLPVPALCFSPQLSGRDHACNNQLTNRSRDTAERSAKDEVKGEGGSCMPVLRSTRAANGRERRGETRLSPVSRLLNPPRRRATAGRHAGIVLYLLSNNPLPPSPPPAFIRPIHPDPPVSFRQRGMDEQKEDTKGGRAEKKDTTLRCMDKLHPQYTNANAWKMYTLKGCTKTVWPLRAPE